MKGMLLASHIHFFMPSVTPNTFYSKGTYIPQGHQYLQFSNLTFKTWYHIERFRVAELFSTASVKQDGTILTETSHKLTINPPFLAVSFLSVCEICEFLVVQFHNHRTLSIYHRCGVPHQNFLQCCRSGVRAIYLHLNLQNSFLP